MGVWIETFSFLILLFGRSVTPFVGVWIETLVVKDYPVNGKSHPSWVCGLKHQGYTHEQNKVSHTLRGCVD